MNIGETLRENREIRGYATFELAKLLDVDAQLICDWEDNRVQPDITRSLLLGKLYGLSLEDLFVDFNVGDVLAGTVKDEFEHERWLNRITQREF